MLRAAVRARRLPILVVGGGVGGMTAALALHRVGQSSHLVMRDKNLSKSGGAVCLMRGGLRILDRLGLGSTIRSIGLPARHGEVYSRRGARLFTFDLDENEVYVVPRPRLRQAFLEALPPSSVSFGTSFKRLDVGSAADDGVTVTLRDLERGADHQVDAGKVIGADGGRSAVRKFITQPGVSLSTGVTAFRATVPNSDLETYPLHTFREVWGDGRASLRFGCCRMTPYAFAASPAPPRWPSRHDFCEPRRPD
jgi:2-polyprenyl-6-methoxyphenol hydroxylase-like FAD-dependent oxidoreductase